MQSVKSCTEYARPLPNKELLLSAQAAGHRSVTLWFVSGRVRQQNSETLATVLQTELFERD